MINLTQNEKVNENLKDLKLLIETCKEDQTTPQEDKQGDIPQRAVQKAEAKEEGERNDYLSQTRDEA